MLQLIFIIPLFSLILNNLSPKFENLNFGYFKFYLNQICMISLSILYFYLVLWISLLYNFNSNEFQFRYFFSFLNYKFSLGIDGISLTLLILIGFIDPILMIIAPYDTKFYNETKEIYNYIIITKLLIILLFLSLDIFLFFLCFELILIPIFFLIFRFGSKYSFFIPRIEASYRFFIYTIIGSIFMLIIIFILFYIFGSTSNEFLLFSLYKLPSNLLILIWALLFFSFIVKIPLFPFHTWLPLAHSDAPTSGSVLLASILLKLASFGILRYSLFIFPSNFLFSFNNEYIFTIAKNFIFILAILSIFFCSFIALRSIQDFKKIIAYSSIVHMSFSIFGFFSSSLEGLFGSSFLMFTHALISSSLFLLVGFLYKRFSSRYLPYYHGLFYFIPLLSFFFLFFSFANISLPFFSSFISEYFILYSSYFINPILAVLLLLSLILSTSFIMWFTNRLLFGSISLFLKPFTSCDLTPREFLSLIPFSFFTFFFAFFPQSVFNFFYLPLLNLI